MMQLKQTWSSRAYGILKSRLLWASLDRTENWLLASCNAEINVHKALFVFVLVPVLGVWLPGIMIYLGWAFAGVSLSLTPSATALSLVSAAIALTAMIWGYATEGRKLRETNERMIASRIELGADERTRVVARLSKVWSSLGTPGQAAPPGLICRPHFGVLAHAYDSDGECLIEVSSGLLARLLRDDPLAIAILRHELAHLVHHDLPVMRRHNALLGGATTASVVAIAITSLAVLFIAAVGFTDAVRSGQALSLSILLRGLIAIAAFGATIAVAIPVGLYALKRYAGFIVALMELRADVSAGVWGGGGELEALSHALEHDVSVRRTGRWDLLRAYVSATLIHFPAQERSRLLADKERLGTPKMRYFAMAIGATWLLGFHQGISISGWDFVLLSAVVATLTGITLSMIMNAGGQLHISSTRAMELGLALLLAQLLVFVPLEGLAYLMQHLSFAIAVPGGFGGDTTVSFWKDIADVLIEFMTKAFAAAGGMMAFFSVAIMAAAFFAMSRLPYIAPEKSGRSAVIVAGSICSVLVSFDFFQPAIHGALRNLAFSLSMNRLYNMNEAVFGTPFLLGRAWLKLALPVLCAFFVAIAFVGAELWRRKRGSGK
ncbi:MAG: hypothetical protein AB7O57_15070 [Hyphomicrobiaceae bacterium]